MSSIRGKNTKPELLLRRELFKRGYRYSLRYRFKELNFKPDLVMVSKKTCIFIDGCFWHGCPKHGTSAKANAEFWRDKIGNNKARDLDTNERLKQDGWLVIRAWEHEDPAKVASKIASKVLARSK